jgi:hypothetical protein
MNESQTFGQTRGGFGAGLVEVATQKWNRGFRGRAGAARFSVFRIRPAYFFNLRESKWQIPFRAPLACCFQRFENDDNSDDSSGRDGSKRLKVA